MCINTVNICLQNLNYNSKFINRTGNGFSGVPRSPNKSKDYTTNQFDLGYDSYSLSSNDSLPLQQNLKHNLQVI